MLIKCKECQKDVSSEAANCPHCGFPVKPQPKVEDVPIVREANSSKSGLGTFFIILGIIGIIIGFVVIQPSDVEGLQSNLIDTSHQAERTSRGFASFTGDSSSANQFHQDGVDAQSGLDSMISDRHTKAACFFIPAGILFVLGLVLRASAKPNT